MAKSNPLFTDSTLLRGDSIGTQIELNDILTYDDENLYFVIVKADGQETYLPMEKVEETGFFEVFVRLVHQKPVKFYFGIEKNGELLLKSEPLERIARYALLETWQPDEKLYPNGRAAAVEADRSGDENTLDVTENDPVSVETAEVLLHRANEIGEMLEIADSPQTSKDSSEASADRQSSTQPMSSVASAKGGSILKPDQVQDITDLMEKWGFS